MKNEKFEQYLVGLTDAEGCFLIQKKMDSQIFIIRLHKRDISILKEIQQYLNCGNIRETDKDMIDFVVSNKSDLFYKIYPIFEKYPLLTRKFYQYEYWKEILIKRIKKIKFERIKKPYKLTENIENSIENILNLEYFDSWLIGFIQGDGSFYKRKDGNRIIPEFNICQKYDKIILEAIKKKLNTNVKIYLEKEDFYRLIIGSKKDLISLIQFLENSKIKFQGYKGEQYINWYNKISTLKNYQICLDKPIL